MDNHDTLKTLRARFGLKDDEIFGDFERSVKLEFRRGLSRVYVRTIIAFLLKHHGSQQAVAEYLGLRDRTSISKMLTSGSMDGKLLVGVLND